MVFPQPVKDLLRRPFELKLAQYDFLQSSVSFKQIRFGSLRHTPSTIICIYGLVVYFTAISLMANDLVNAKFL